MKVKTLLSLAALLILAVSFTSASLAAPTNGSDPRVILDKLYTQPGIIPIRDLIVQMDCCDTNENGSLVMSSKDKIYYLTPNKVRIDTIQQAPGSSMDQRQHIIIRDGTNAWMYASTGQYPIKKGPDNPDPTSNLPFFIQRYPADNNKVYQITGTKQIDGVQTTVISITNPQKANDVRTVYIDTQRNVPLRQDLNFGDKKEIKGHISYKNIKKLPDGRYFPHTIEIYHNETLMKVRVYTGVQANVGLKDDLFAPMQGLGQ